MRLSLLLAALLLFTSTGCETITSVTCDSYTVNVPQHYAGGTTQDGVYMSSPWNEGLLYFPGGMQYSLAHGLGSTPAWEYSYLSFQNFGAADGGNVAQAAGNQVVILGMNDQTIQLANDSCTDYWLLVTAGVGTAAPSGP